MMRLLFTVFALLLGVGCEKRHPASGPAQDVLDAVRFADKEGLFQRTLDTVENPYCTSDEFARIVKRAQDAAEKGICLRLKTLEAEQVGAVAEELQLFLQIQNAVCENDSLDCHRYSRMVLEGVWERLPKTTGATLVKVMGEAERAVAYVELERNGVTHTRTLAFELRSDTWFLVSLEALL